MPAFAGWENFYVIVGSAAGALIGLQFVVVTLIANTPAQGTVEVNAAFGTPSVVHFGVVLFLAAVVSAPWQGIGIVAVLWGVVGLIGSGYAVIVARRMRVQTDYQPEFEDWLFHGLLPLAAYALLFGTACMAAFYTRPAMFGVGAAVLLLLFIGIHNAWDSVAYVVFTRRRNTTTERRSAEARIGGRNGRQRARDGSPAVEQASDVAEDGDR